MYFERVSIDPGVMLGKPSIKRTRITVELIPDKLSGGADVEGLLTFTRILEGKIFLKQLVIQKQCQVTKK